MTWATRTVLGLLSILTVIAIQLGTLSYLGHLDRPAEVLIVDAKSVVRIFVECPSSYKMGHQTGLSFGVSGSSVGLIMQPVFDVASGDTGLSVS